MGTQPTAMCRNRLVAAVAGIEPASRRLTAVRPYQHGPHRNGGGEIRGCQTKQVSGRPRTADRPDVGIASQTPLVDFAKRPAGVEPALPPWQGSRLPLHHGRLSRRQIVKQQTAEQRSDQRSITELHIGCPLSADSRFQPPPFRPTAGGGPVSRTCSSGIAGTRTLTRPVKSRGCCR